MAPCWGPAFLGGPCDTARCRPPARPPGRSCRSRGRGRGWAGCRQDRSGAAAVNSRSHRRPHALAAGLSLCVADPQREVVGEVFVFQQERLARPRGPPRSACPGRPILLRGRVVRAALSVCGAWAAKWRRCPRGCACRSGTARPCRGDEETPEHGHGRRRGLLTTVSCREETGRPRCF